MNTRVIWSIGGCVAILSFLFVGAYALNLNAMKKYETQLSVVTFDRNRLPIKVRMNSRDHYALTLTTIPDSFRKLLVEKEDRFFYFHFGINPFSTARTVFHSIRGGDLRGGSTISQQLAKNLLGNESDRTVKHKAEEALYALSLELFHTKETILVMYANTVFLGNQIQGFETGSYAYFNKRLIDTTPNEQLSLLATLSHPSTRNPWESDNLLYAEKLHTTLSLPDTFSPPQSSHAYALQATSSFELTTAHIDCETTCSTSIDATVTEDVRGILSRHIAAGYERGARNGSVVIINPQTSQVISIVGSPNPQNERDGHKINMALEPRPIGSTIKPFIYLKGFMEGLRPYTLVEDREYKFGIATGFSLYPKNYDGQYHGTVTLHEALSNSLNVPSVQVLSFIGLNPFYAFLDESLHFKPLQSYDSYQYGIALGGLEMDLLTLSHYFSLFPRGGTLAPLKTIIDRGEQPALPPQSTIDTTITVAPTEYTELVHAIISDRLSGVNQFGLKSNLNLTAKGYGVKTGTSRDFHDSWVVGYTGDFVVGVWVGNSENTALAQVSGESGAGAIWHDVMEYMLASPYNAGTEIKSSHLARMPFENSDEWGLPADDIPSARNLLISDQLVLSIHVGDRFELATDTRIPLRARKEVLWSINGESQGAHKETQFSPTKSGTYEITAYDATSNTREIVPITVVSSEQR